MADDLTVKYLYPPNFLGTYGEREGDEHIKGPRRYIVQCTCISDGTGEVDSVKVRRTDLRNTNGQTPDMLKIDKIQYQIDGMELTIGYNNENDEKVAVIGTSARGELVFPGGFIPESDRDDPLGGDIVFTTKNPTANDTYNVIMWIRPGNDTTMTSE